MSSDNGIYILKTTDKCKKIDDDLFENIDEGITAYRVSHAQGIDSFDWYEEFEPYNTGKYMWDIFGDSEIYYNSDDAMNKALEIMREVKYTEYGIRELDASIYSFPG